MDHTQASRIPRDICLWANRRLCMIPHRDWGDFTAWQRDMREGRSIYAEVGSSLTTRYMPVAVEALSQLANRAGGAQGSSGSRSTDSPAHYDTSQVMEMPIPTPTPGRQPSDSSIRSRTFSHAAGAESYGNLGVSSSSNRPYPFQHQSQRSSSESIQSGNSGNGRWAEASYEQINKEDAISDAQASRPPQGRRTSSGRWFGWAGGDDTRAKVD